MSPQVVRLEVLGCCFPRVSGDEPLGDITQINWAEFSPRERG